MKKKILLGTLILVMSMSLTACKSTDYKNAVKLQDSADYTSALKIYENLGADYKDVSERTTECKSYIAAIANFKTAAAKTDTQNTDLDSKVTSASQLITSGTTALDENLRPALESAVSDTKAARQNVPEMPQTLDKITNTTKTLDQIDYTTVLDNLDTAYTALDISIKQYALVNNPAESYLISSLKQVPNVVDISAVTEDNDPNGQLNKAGGYTAQVYFSSDLVDQSKVSGSTVIDRGTDGGGSIEVYATAEDAKKRNDYLTGFDGSLFASGSHSVIGTCIVRTSDKMTSTHQKELEAKIISVLTAVEN